MNTKKIINYLLILTFFVILCPFISFGQTTPDGNFLELSTSPTNPEPGQNVKVTLASYYYDLNRIKITWLIDGQIKKSDLGLREYSTEAGRNGQKTTITAKVETTDGIKEISTSFIPSVVDLIYESLAYTPPFYKGRALNTNQGVVLVTAIPEFINTTGNKISAQNIIYSWKKDGKVQQSASGVGKNVFVFNGTIPIRDATIEVTASSPDSTIYATKKVTIPNSSPKIIFYENNPIYGIMMNRAITNPVQMFQDEFSVIAIPYFFSVNYPTTPDLDYVWSMNNKVVDNQAQKNIFTSRIDAPGSGIANIGLKINNNVRIFQFTDSSYNINFYKQ